MEKFVKNTLANSLIAIVVAFIALVSSAVSVVSPVSASNEAIYKGSNKTAVSLMVNVYWGNDYIDEMLAIFDKNHVKTTFFMGGMWVRDNEEIFRKIVDHGHEIGNHGFYHKEHNRLTQKRNREEILATHSLVKSICGIEMHLFAPPSGAVNSETVDIASQLGYTTIMWSKDTIDWRDQDENVLFRRATKNICGGDLVLMHPTKSTVAVLEKIIMKIKADGLDILPVGRVINPEILEN